VENAETKKKYRFAFRGLNGDCPDRNLLLTPIYTGSRIIIIVCTKDTEPFEGYINRQGRSCTDAIFTVQQIIEKRKEQNLPLFILFIDYEKAYDNVNRDKLWEMMDNKIPNYLLNTIKCIYRNTKVRIKFNGGVSEPIHINKGVRQGCGLSPVLFKIYINKIIQEFKIVIKKGIQLNNRKLVNTILYADDQILMATSEDDLQTMTYHLNLIARKYKMTISSTKTKSMAMGGTTYRG